MTTSNDTAPLKRLATALEAMTSPGDLTLIHLSDGRTIRVSKQDTARTDWINLDFRAEDPDGF